MLLILLFLFDRLEWINLKRYGILSEQIVQFNPQYDLNDKSIKFILFNYIKCYIQTAFNLKSGLVFAVMKFYY